jgi:hypothetical protein
LALIGLRFGSRGSRRVNLFDFALLFFIWATLIILSGCGGGGSSSGGGGGGLSGGTPSGTYTITITGKDANSLTQTGNPATVTVTVN